MKPQEETSLTNRIAGPLSRAEETFVPQPYARVAATDSPPEGPVTYWRMLARHKWTIVLLSFVGTVVGVVITLPQTPVYQARASVEVEGLNENFLNLKDFNPTSPPGGYLDPSYVQTEVKILESPSLREQTVRRLMREGDPSVPILADRLATWRKLLHLTPKQEMKREDVIRAAVSGVQIKVSGATRIIDVLVDSPDPHLAADFTNTLMDEFIEKNLEDRWRTTERTGQWLAKQLDELKIKLEKSEDAMQAYATTVGLQFTEGDRGDKEKDGDRQSVAESSVRLMQQDVLKARADRIAAQSKYELISTSPSEALPQVLDDPALHEYQTKLTDLRRQLAEMSPTLTPEHHKMQRVQAQIAVLQEALETERSHIVRRLGNDYKAAAEHESLLSREFGKQLKTLNDQSAKEFHYVVLKREADTNRQLYESMLEKVKESGIASEMRASNFRIVDSAKTPKIPYKPSLMNNSLFGCVAGVFLGVVVVVLREQADRSIQQPGDSPQFLGIHELGVIPSERSLPLGRARLPVTQRVLTDREIRNCLELVTWEQQSSLIAECFRTVMLSIMFSEHNACPPRVLLTTSVNPAEGKTTVASNLAIVLAEIQQKVLLIDADMRRPNLHNIYGLRNDVGLSRLLQEKNPLHTSSILLAIRKTRISDLHLMTSGPLAANAATLLHSPRLPEVLQTVRENFDVVIIDSPPMLHLSDARLLGRHANAVLLVLRAGKTTRAAGVAAMQTFAADGTPILGTVLNDWNPRQNGYGYDYRYYADHEVYYTNQAARRPQDEGK